MNWVLPARAVAARRAPTRSNPRTMLPRAATRLARTERAQRLLPLKQLWEGPRTEQVHRADQRRPQRTPLVLPGARSRPVRGNVRSCGKGLSLRMAKAYPPGVNQPREGQNGRVRHDGSIPEG